MRTAAWARLVFGSLLAVAFLAALRAEDSACGDDGWRRTASGWERKELWARPLEGVIQGRVVFPPKPPEARPRWDVHPAMLAAGQAIAVAAAFLLWSKSVAPSSSDQARRRGCREVER